MSNLNKLALLNALIETSRQETKLPDTKVANKAKGRLIGLYRAKKALQDLVELDAQRVNIFRMAG